MQMKTFQYTCQECNHQWTDALLPQAADAPVKQGCPMCASKNITYQQYQSGIEYSTSLGFSDPTRITNQKPDEGFRDVLRKVKEAHPLSPIDPDK